VRLLTPAVWRTLAGLAFAWLVALAAFSLPPLLEGEGGLPVLTIAAARGGADGAVPSEGWTPVSLPDHWSDRWPAHDGSVWYRIRWQAQAAQPVAILADSYTSAAQAWVNGSMVHGDARLVEPLTQNQYRAHLWVVDTPVVHAGVNTLLVRVAGVGGFWPGLGRVRVGDVATLSAAYERLMLGHYNAQFVNVGACLACGLICLCFWFFRRRESTYGWAALAAFAWVCFEWHLVTSTPWPLASTLGVMVLKTISLMGACLAGSMVLLRLAGARLPRVERAACAVVAVVALVLLLAPAHVVVSMRHPTQMASGAAGVLAATAFVAHTLYTGALRSSRGLIAGLVILVLPILAQDLMSTAGVVHQYWFLLPQVVPLFLVVLSLMLAARLAKSLHLSERFNEQLQDSVAQARAQLSQALEKERMREVALAREAERRRLVHDLHDGLGSTLVGNISALEAGGPAPSAEQVLAVLHDVRNDLRLVIDTSFNVVSERPLAEALATLRHRMSTSLERQGLHVSWTIPDLRHAEADAAQTLDLMRALQELVTNAVRHARPTEIAIAVAGRDGFLGLQISDNGGGFDPQAPHVGVGLKGLRVRAQRLGGRVDFVSGPGGTTASLTTTIRLAPPGG
jgi:signal transduction histidine kinase